MKLDYQNCTEEQLWKYVGSHLKKNGIDTVLVGGAVVSVYTDGAYRSGDLDFIVNSYFDTDLKKHMMEIGFEQEGRHFVHPKIKHIFVEFPGKPPIGIGEDYSIVPDEIQVEGQKIKIYSPTDSVKDRLATYIYFKDREGLEQAVLVGKKHPVNKGEIKRWCVGEKYPEVFDEWERLLK